MVHECRTGTNPIVQDLAAHCRQMVCAHLQKKQALFLCAFTALVPQKQSGNQHRVLYMEKCQYLFLQDVFTQQPDWQKDIGVGNTNGKKVPGANGKAWRIWNCVDKEVIVPE